MNLLIKYVCFSFVVLLVRDCNSSVRSLGPADYVNWVEDPENGLHITKAVGETTIELQYKPQDYQVLKDNPQTELSLDEFKSQQAEISDMQYFTLRISNSKGGDLLRSDASGVSDFSQRLAYFSSAMQKDISLIDGKDTVKCLLFHFERSYGIDPRSTFVLGFPFAKNKNTLPGKNEDKTVLFDDHEIGTGPVMITIEAEKLALLPQLKLD